MNDYELPTYDRVVELADKYVENVGPDYVYPVEHWRSDENDNANNCKYTYQDRPSCIVGHIMHDLNVPIAHLKANEGNGTSSLLERLYGELTATTIEAQAIDFLAHVQYLQDKGVPWSKAVETAKKAIDYDSSAYRILGRAVKEHGNEGLYSYTDPD